MSVEFDNAQLGVIVPTLNEGTNVWDIITRLKNVGCENILIVDGNSNDDTVECAQKLGARVVLQDGTGKGGALRQGFRECMPKSDIIVIMDADGSMAPEELPRFTKTLMMGADVVKGSRFLPDGGSSDLTLSRRIGNMILTLILNKIFLTDYTDLCYGYMAFKKDALKQLSGHLESKKFEIETEICIKSRKLGLNVFEIPSFERSRRCGKSNLKTLRDGLCILSLLLRESLKKRTLKRC